ncbi:MAG: class I SAM-dependent methyltransferase [Bacteroidia bacterium]|nr:class I SAM-dependent methyltransferase [Bacteroidia bacterium]
MEFISEAISNYSEQHSEAESPLLNELNRETHLKALSPRMLSGHLQGRVLSFISKLASPKNILEIGTYTGYSALCLAEGLQPEGKLITIDPNEETNIMASKYFQRSAYAKQIELKAGDATKLIPTLTQTFDIVFIDADKRNYALYFDLIIDKVKKGGLIITDNVLWSGKVVMPENEMDVDTKAIHDFNKKVNGDKRVTNLLLPVRDGLMLMMKK